MKHGARDFGNLQHKDETNNGKNMGEKLVKKKALAVR